MKLNKVMKVLLIFAVSGCCLVGCSNEKKEADFSGINSVCELATLKCYYHNVAKVETEASGLFKWLGTGYKKIWTEYSGIVELGIDVNKVSISKPDADGVVKITILDAEILDVDLDEESMREPLTDSGFMTQITKEEETAALAEAQDNMEEIAQANGALLVQAKERAKNLIEGYVKNEFCVTGLEAESLANQVGTTYATAVTGGVRVRETTSASEDTEILDVLEEGGKIKVDTEAETAEGWVPVKLEEGTGYVSEEFVEVELKLGKAISIEEERAAIAAAEAEKLEGNG